jgi:CHAT domain-containing protein
VAIRWNLLRARDDFLLNQTEASRQELSQARLLTESAHSPLIGEVLRAEGLMLRDSGDWDGAAEKFKRSLAAARQQGDPLLQALNLVDLSAWGLQAGRFDEAARLSKEAADFAMSVHANRQLQMAVGNAGWAYEGLGDFDHALSNFLEAERRAAELGATRDRVRWLQNAGVASYRLGNLSAARNYDEQALQLARTLPNSTDQLANIQANLATLLSDQALYEQAAGYSNAARLSGLRSKDPDVRAYTLFVHGLLALHQHQAAAAQTELLDALQQATDADLRTDIESALAESDVSAGDESHAELWYRQSIRTFEAKRQNIHDESDRLSDFAYGSGAYRAYADFLISRARSREALALLDRSRARTLEEGLGIVDPGPKQSPDSESPQTLARKRAALLLFYSIGPKHSHLWAIDAKQIRVIDLPGEETLRNLIARHRKSIERSADLLREGPDGDAARSLYQILVAPVADMAPKGGHVFVIPDGVLYGLNFETLIEQNTEAAKFWIEDVAVNVANSLRMLSRDALKSGAPDQNLLLVGDPVTADAEFQALPNASLEIQRVRAHFPADRESVLTRELASPSRYGASHPEQFSYIHFVAHGTANRLSPMDSAVILSPEGEDAREFKLYAREIVRHPLRADLVTISACYGSGSRTYAGEGLVGLAWSFLRAGAHQVVGALWQVDDASTPLLMDRFYGALQGGESASSALRAAKLSLLHSSSPYRKPFYWGAFQLYVGS